MANMYGRPLKGRKKRVHITLSVDQATLEEVDEHILKEREGRPTYTRSDFYEEAAAAFLRQAEASETAERNKIVTE